MTRVGNRDYFSHGESEYVDTMSGHLVLRNVDLALAGNRRNVLRVGRVFSGGGWNMGLLDTVIEASTDLQAGDSGAAYLKTGDGAVHYAHWIAPAPYNSAGCMTGCRSRWTSDFWLSTDRSAPSRRQIAAT